MSDDLEAILSGAEVDDVTVGTTDQPAEEAPAETVADAETVAAEDNAPTDEKPAEQAADESSSSEDAKDSSSDNVKAGLEAELARVRAKNRDLEETLKGKQAEPEPKKDFFDDPDAALQTMEQRFEQRMTQERISWSEQAARQRYDDFDDKTKVFEDLATEDPTLWSRLAQAPDPAEFAYKHATQTLKMREFGSIDTFEEKIRADEREKARKEIVAEYEKKLGTLSDLPGSLSNARAAGGNSSPPVTNEALEDILGR